MSLILDFIALMGGVWIIMGICYLIYVVFVWAKREIKIIRKFLRFRKEYIRRHKLEL